MRSYTHEDYPLLQRLVFEPHCRNGKPGLTDISSWLNAHGIDFKGSYHDYRDILEKDILRLWQESRYALTWLGHRVGVYGSDNHCFACLRDIAIRDWKCAFALLDVGAWQIEPLPFQGETMTNKIDIPNDKRTPKFRLIQVNDIVAFDGTVLKSFPELLVDTYALSTYESVAEYVRDVACTRHMDIVTKMTDVEHISAFTAEHKPLLEVWSLFPDPNALLCLPTYHGCIVEVVKADTEVVCRNVMSVGLDVRLKLGDYVPRKLPRLQIDIKMRGESEFKLLCRDLVVTSNVVELLKDLSRYPEVLNEFSKRYGLQSQTLTGQGSS